MLKSIALLVALACPVAGQVEKIVINVPDPPPAACFVNTVTVRNLGRHGNQILLQAVPNHAGAQIILGCQDGTYQLQGPTFAADAAMDSPASFPSTCDAQCQLNTLAIDIGSFPAGYHWFNATFSSGATGSIYVLVPGS